MTEDEVRVKLTEIFHEAFADHRIVLTDGMTAKDIPGWDSLKMVNILVAVETVFGIKLRSREIDGLQTVGDLVRLIGMKTDQRTTD